MLKKINRISKKKELEEIKSKGELIHSPIFGLKWMKKEDKEIKWGWIVSKRISKKAVERNKIKRVLAEALKRNWKEMKEGWRGVFLVKRAMLGKRIEEVESEALKALKELK